MKIGVVGLPNVGKSTLFNALTRAGAQSSNFPFTTIDPNVGIVRVPDGRIDFLANVYNPKKVTYATIEFVDIAGLVRGAASGEGLGNKFLGHIREVDAIVHVVRCFSNPDIIHVDGEVNPIRDIQTINLELILSDIESLSRRKDKLAKEMKSGTGKDKERELNLLLEFEKCLVDQRLVSSLGKSDPFHLLTSKPVIYLANLNDDGKENEHFKAVQELARREGNAALGICAKIEEELSQIEDEVERHELMEVYGLDKSGLDRLIALSYETLGLISFLTAGESEVRAWTVELGTRAPAAAGRIHTDFERGFIRAEVVAFSDFMEYKSLVKVREAGKYRSEGKDYIIKDGDVILFRFNV
ncbi:MAG: redox-regulated ATPase YchF [Firmicutes bacterium]|nr:redox-regulated ATPase YchF [Bacillota bacterium]